MKELRSIVVGEREIFEAVVGYRRRRREPLPAGEVRGFALADRPAVSARFLLEGPAGERGELACRGEELASAVLEWLTGRCVPLPRSAAKNLFAVGRELTLVLEVPDGAERPPARPRKPVRARARDRAGRGAGA